ncbi:hypothetical protein [Halosimplex sp. TS25]|uniref:hypothetical protein n=1 Tax=Halosimplex rarum TaxID=3396619 RepID=UPI0039E9EEF4
MNEERRARDGPETDEEALVGECTECGQVYSLQRGADGTVVPMGTDGVCQCGNDEFEPLSDL